MRTNTHTHTHILKHCWMDKVEDVINSSLPFFFLPQVSLFVSFFFYMATKDKALLSVCESVCLCVSNANNDRHWLFKNLYKLLNFYMYTNGEITGLLHLTLNQRISLSVLILFSYLYIIHSIFFKLDRFVTEHPRTILFLSWYHVTPDRDPETKYRLAKRKNLLR